MIPANVPMSIGMGTTTRSLEWASGDPT